MSFITIKFGDDKEALFNPNCLVINLLDNIKKRCSCEKDTEIDLTDTDGSVQKLSEKQNQNASTILQQRGEYILLRVERFLDKPNVYLPLLNGLENSNPLLLAKLQNSSKPEEEQQKQQTHRKKSPWDRANIRKVTSRAKETSNVSSIKTDGSRENTPKSDEKISGANSERRTAKRKPGLKTL